MSPAHVERYIGSCLITSGYKPPRYRRYPEYAAPGYQPGWAALPLIAVSSRKKEDRSPLSRLAIHTQGAPLIQSGRGSQGRRPSGKPQGEHRKPQPTSQHQVKEGDEPANSENSLPRIIKPRKRRKKERKPQQESSIVTLKPYTPLCSDLPAVEQEAPPIVSEERLAECQCRYCDPLGVIWEARTPAAWPDEQTSTDDSSSSGSGLEVSSEIVTSPNGHRDIEIRFFTTPPPLPPRPNQPVVVSPPWR